MASPRPHWANCITHFDEELDAFIQGYFAAPERTCLLVAGAGFDPRARMIAERLGPVLGDRLRAVFFREERFDPNQALAGSADDTEAALRKLVPNCTVLQINVFAEDGASIGGHGVSNALRNMTWPEVSDIVLDMSALSVGIGFPAARILLEYSEQRPDLNFHLMVVSNPELDARIVPEPSGQAAAVRGFAGPTLHASELPSARVWLPHLAPGKKAILSKIHSQAEGDYKVCPVLPFPARDPRRADDLIAEYQSELRDEWNVDARDIIYVSERNPLDAYRTFSTLKQRYDRSMAEVFALQFVLSPVGSKVMAAGALMAAIEHDLAVHHVEALRYELNPHSGAPENELPYMTVHVWLDGPVYDGVRESG